MRTIGLDPMETLVMPRLFALAIALPLLVFFANAMALAGGATMVIVGLDLSLPQFFEQLASAVTFSTFLVGLIKAPVFAVLIGMVACYEGLKVSGSAESVGIHTTRSVVKSIIARLRNEFNVAAAEVGDHDLWQTAELGIVTGSSSRAHADEMIAKAVDFIERLRLDFDMGDYETEVTEVL